MNFIIFMLINFILLLILLPDLPIAIQLIWLWALLALGVWRGNKYIKELM